MTLWSRLKTCFAIKLVGSCAGVWAWADTSCMVHLKRCGFTAQQQKMLDCLLQRRLLLQPVVVVLLRQHAEICLHVVVTQTTKLGADDLIAADLVRREMQGKIKSRNKVLLHSQLRDKEGMSHVFGVHEQMNLAVYGDRHLGRDDVVFRVLILGLVDAEEVL